jgi:hypothetical protein
MARDVEVIWVKREREYFCAGDWTTQIRLNAKENFFSAVIPGRGKAKRTGQDSNPSSPGLHFVLADCMLAPLA